MTPTVKVFRKNPTWLQGVMGNVAKVGDKVIACGYPKGKAQAYPGGENVASVAARNCWGIGVIQRDFMSYADEKIPAATREVMIKIWRVSNLPGDHTEELARLRERAGLLASNEIKMAIRDGAWEPNSDLPMSEHLREQIGREWGVKIPKDMSYRAAKYKFHHSDKPLIDTAHMINATTYVVRDR